MTQTPKLTSEEKALLQQLWQLQTQMGVGLMPEKDDDLTVFQRLETLKLVEHVGRLWYLTVAGEELTSNLASASSAEEE